MNGRFRLELDVDPEREAIVEELSGVDRADVITALLEARKVIARQVGDLDRLRFLEREHAELRGKYDAAVEELRELRRERDPERIERELDARVARAVAATVVKLANAKGQIVELESEVRELREGKRRLRDALERAKAGRS